MKLTVYWLTIMAILPLFYLWWWKKQQRLILGVIILALVGIGLFFPGEITYSILAREIEKESKIKANKIDDIINNAANQKNDSENSEKIKKAKEIVEINKEAKKLKELYYKEKTPLNLQNWKLIKLLREEPEKQAWVRKWSQEKFLSALLFCGEEFNDKLGSKNIIDFANYRDSNPEIIKEKIFDIAKKAEKEKWETYSKDFSVVWLKNIDKITSPELRQWFLEIFDPKKDNDFWKYKDNKEATPNLLRLIFIVTTSNPNPPHLNDYRQKLHHIEPTLDKYFWIIFLSSAGVEIIIFVLLIRNKKKSENKAFKKFSY